MRLRNVTGSREVIAGSRFVVPEEEQKECPGNWRDIFGNQNPLYIEIGMGKGKFIHTMAKENPQINFVGIEKYSTVLLRAVQKMEQEELPNLKFLRMDAEEITEVFGNGEVDRIYESVTFKFPFIRCRRHARVFLFNPHFLSARRVKK